MKSVFFLIIFSLSLFAVDVSNFDIKGIKLGMSKSEVLKKMPCNNPDILNVKLNKKIIETDITCKNTNFQVELDHYGYVYYVFKGFFFETEPKFSKLKSKILSKYNQPNKVAEDKLITEGGGKAIEFCWGRDCRSSTITNNRYRRGANIRKGIKGKYLLITYKNEYFNSGHINSLWIDLEDETRRQNNANWKEKEKAVYEKQQKEKVSNIDF